MLVSFFKHRVLFTLMLLLMVFAAAGCSSSSDSDNSIPLSSPASIQATGKDGYISLMWTRLSAAQGVTPSYEIWYSETSDSGMATLAGTVESTDSMLVQYDVTGLTNGTLYYFWTKAVYAGLGTADFGGMTSGTPVGVPTVPASAYITAGETLLEVYWTAPEYAFTYEVAYSDTNDISTASTKTVSSEGAVITELTNDTLYYVWVKAINTAGESDYVSLTGTPVAATIAPATPVISSVESGNKRLKVSWEAVSGAVNYTLYYNTSNNSATAASVSVEPNINTVTASITGLVNGTTYYIWVEAVNSQGSSGLSGNSTGIPEEKDVAIDYNDYSFVLGDATSEYIYAEYLPISIFANGGKTWDRLTRVKETALGNLFTDSVAWYVKEKYPEENLDFVFLNGSYIDNTFGSTSQITVQNVMATVDPDGVEDTIVLLTLKGSDVKELFSFMAATVPHTGRGGPTNTKYWANVSSEINYSVEYLEAPQATEANKGTITHNSAEMEPYIYGTIMEGTLTYNGADIDDNAEYRIATTSYLATGAFYLIFATKGYNTTDLLVPYWHGVAEYIYDQGQITPELDGRVKIYGGIPLGSSGYNYTPGALE